MTAWLFAPFGLQGAVMLVDEFHFHRKRGMGKWERIGHPLDTLTVLAPLSLTLLVPRDDTHSTFYIALCAFSCLFITKDEFVHARECEPLEQWLHSLLFVLHPLVFVAAYLAWPELPELGAMAWLPFAAIVALLIHQVAYWNFPWKTRP